MRKEIFFLLMLLLLLDTSAQQMEHPCSLNSLLDRMDSVLPQSRSELKKEMEKSEQFIQDFILYNSSSLKTDSEYIIPVVLHVFHLADDGKMGLEQALSGLEVLNNDFNGLNDGWNSIEPEFDSIKASLDIRFCLAQIDPEGNPTTGVIYHEDSLAMYNQGNLFQHAWDNYRYLNIYLPKYTEGGPSDFTGYAFFPSLSNVENNTDGIFYSSIRWGYGENSELEPAQDWASVCTHEAGHWLNLFHPFQYGCNENLFGDRVEDTPNTLNNGIELEGCNNNDFSCGVRTNGENFMDYNHDCKKMFTAGQVERMIAALSHSARVNLWSEDNVGLTGCSESFSTVEENNELGCTLFPNPTRDMLNVTAAARISTVQIFDLSGKLLIDLKFEDSSVEVDMSAFETGIYLLQISGESWNVRRKVLVEK